MRKRGMISAMVVVSAFVLIILTSCGNTVSTIDGQFVENGYNNLVFNNGNLVRINNSLFYNYNETNDIFNYGLYEITSSGRKKIKVPDSFIFSDKLEGMQSYKEMLLIGSADDTNNIEAYSLTDESFTSIDFFADSFEKQVKQYYAFGNVVYVVTDSEVYEVLENTVERLFDRSVVRNLNVQPYSDESDVFCGMYFSKEKIYYIDAKSAWMCDFDTKSHETNKIFNTVIELSKLNLSIDNIDSQFFVIDDYVIFSVDQDGIMRFYAYSIPQKNTRLIDMDFDGLTHINTFNGQLVLGNEEDGLYLYDLEEGHIEKVSESGVSEIYVFDNKYIYFKTPSRNLYRFNSEEGSARRVL